MKKCNMQKEYFRPSDISDSRSLLRPTIYHIIILLVLSNKIKVLFMDPCKNGCSH